MPATVSLRVDALLWPTVFDELKQILLGYGGDILFADLAPIYAGLYPETDLRRVLYTGLSDGQNIILHNKRADIRSPVQWAWDSLHLFGHMLQWHMDQAQAESLGIQFWGLHAQAMAIKNFLGCTPEELIAMQNYELEANGLSLSLFSECIRRSRPSPNDAELFGALAEMRQYIAKDIAFLTRYYTNSGRHEYDSSLFSEQRLLSEIAMIDLPSGTALKFKEISQICVPVVHNLPS